MPCLFPSVKQNTYYLIILVHIFQDLNFYLFCTWQLFCDFSAYISGVRQINQGVMIKTYSKGFLKCILTWYCSSLIFIRRRQLQGIGFLVPPLKYCFVAKALGGSTIHFSWWKMDYWGWFRNLFIEESLGMWEGKLGRWMSQRAGGDVGS